MKKEKIKKIIKNDTKFLLIATAIIGIITFLLSAPALTVMSIILFIWLLYVSTRKKEDLYNGITMIFISAMMIVGGLCDGSLFNVIYLLLGIIYLVHGIIYIKYTKVDKSKNHVLLVIMYLIQAFIFWVAFIYNP